MVMGLQQEKMMNDLVLYDNADHALDELENVLTRAESFDSVNGARITSESIRSLCKAAGNVRLQNKAAITRIKAERLIGRMLSDSDMNAGGGDQYHRSHDATTAPTLSDMGINKSQSSRWQKIAKVDDHLADSYFDEAIDSREITTADFMKETTGSLVGKHTGDEESYTPPQYVDAACKVMGAIDLDPASNDMAQKVVKATKYYTIDDDGLTKQWKGKVWMNPPYTSLVINRFIDKLVSHYISGDISEAIVLTNNNTDTKWFDQAAGVASGICFTKGRINFMKRDGSFSSPTNGQVFFYFGDNIEMFAEEYSEFGRIMINL